MFYERDGLKTIKRESQSKWLSAPILWDLITPYACLEISL